MVSSPLLKRHANSMEFYYGIFLNFILVQIIISKLVPRERKFVEHDGNSLFDSVPKRKILLQQEKQYQGPFEPWRYLQSV